MGLRILLIVVGSAALKVWKKIVEVFFFHIFHPHANGKQTLHQTKITTKKLPQKIYNPPKMNGWNLNMFPQKGKGTDIDPNH